MCVEERWDEREQEKLGWTRAERGGPGGFVCLVFLVMSSDGLLLHAAGHAGPAVDVLSGIEALQCSRTCYVLHSICMHERAKRGEKPVMAAFFAACMDGSLVDGVLDLAGGER